MIDFLLIIVFDDLFDITNKDFSFFYLNNDLRRNLLTTQLLA